MRVRKALGIFLLVLFLGAFAMGMVFVVYSGSVSRALSGDIPDFNSISSVSELTEGGFVKGRADRLGDEFACTESQKTGLLGEKSGAMLHYYVMPLENIDGFAVKYIALCIGNEEAVSSAEVMVKEFNDNWAYGVSPDEWTAMSINGKVSRLDEELYKQFYDVIAGGDEEASPEDIEPYIIPYVITYIDTESISKKYDMGIVMIMTGLIGAAVDIMVLMRKKRDYDSEGDDEEFCEEEDNKDTE